MQNMNKTKKVLTGDRKTQIIDSAIKVFIEKGYEKSSLREIVALVGITKPTLYHYFNSKHDLLYKILHDAITVFIDDLVEILKQPVSSNEKVRLMLQSLFNAQTRNNSGLAVLLHESKAPLPSDLQNEIKKMHRKFISLTEDLFIEGIENKEFRSDLDPKIIAWAFLGMINWTHNWASSDGRLGFDEISEMFATIFINGVQHP